MPLFKAPREDGSWFRAELDCSECSSTIQPQQEMKTKNMTTLHLRKSMGRLPLGRGLLLIALAWFGLSPTAQALLPPPAPDGRYPNGNTAEGDGALFRLTTGFDNTANGDSALFFNTNGSFNTANGFEALFRNTTGTYNTANGLDALVSNTTGSNNTATGVAALYSNTTGGSNTATGVGALSNNNADNNTATGVISLANNVSGNNNTADGVEALLNNTSGSFNTATGAGALQSNTTGDHNAANGSFALANNTFGNNNTADGADALLSNTTGSNNTANGTGALYHNTGGDNTATGVNALTSNTIGGNNTAEGFQALQHNTGSNNIALGSNAGVNLTTGSNDIDIGNGGVAAEAAKIRIGTVGTQTATFIAGIHGVAVTGAAIVVSSSGQLGVAPSSQRFKDAIKPMNKASEAILALKPVTFRYKREFDPECTPRFGLVAEDVEKVNPNLVAHDADGKVYTVRYEAVNAMLLNEFLKEHKKVEKLEGVVASLAATVKEQAAQIQKVSAHLEASKPAPQVVNNNQ
jgi:hypothetical protein